LRFGFGILFVFMLAANVYALNLDKVKVNFLNGDYQAAISEGEKILAHSRHAPDLDELYYLLGLSYAKEKNYLRASDIFEIILKEFKTSKFKDKAKLGLGDTYLFQGDLDKAQDIYQELLQMNPQSALRPQVYYRLSQVAFKKGDPQLGRDYLDKLEKESPQNIETKLNQDLLTWAESPAGVYYAVQVGVFSSSINAKNLTEKLVQSGYPAYIQEASAAPQEKMYRVKVGKLTTRPEAEALKNKLSQEGYPTKVCP